MHGADRGDADWKRASTGFGGSIRFRGSARFGFRDGFPPELVFRADSGFDFGFRFWVHGDSTQSESDLSPSLKATQLSSAT